MCMAERYFGPRPPAPDTELDLFLFQHFGLGNQGNEMRSVSCFFSVAHIKYKASYVQEQLEIYSGSCTFMFYD